METLDGGRTKLSNGNGAVTGVDGNGVHPVRNGKEPAQRRAQKQRRRRVMIAVISIALLALIAVWFKLRAGQGDTTLKDLQTATATHTTLIETVSASGSVTAQTGAQVKIGSQVTGRIKRLFADVGSHVSANQIIAELDLPDTQAQLNQAEATLSQAVTKYQQQVSGVPMQRTQSVDAVRTALQNMRAAEAKRAEATTTARMQPLQTASDIRHSTAALGAATVAQRQAQGSYSQEIDAAQAAVIQSRANVTNTAASLSREMKLFKQGYVAASDVDNAQAQADVAAAQLNSAEQNLSLAQTKAASDLQTTRQQAVEAQAALQTSEAGRYQDIIKQQDVANADAAVQQAQAALNSSQAGLAQNTLKQQDVKQAQEAIQVALQQVKFQQAQVAKTYIRSPISGTVLQMAAQQGETLAAGLSAPTLIVVADLNRLQVDAFVDESDIGKVKMGESATVTVDAYPDRKFEGKVFKVASGSTMQQNVVTYDVSISIHDPNHLLKPDMTAAVTIAVGEHPNVIAVPNEAIKPGKTGSFVWILKAGAKEPEMQPVETGATDGTNTEITSGVAEGDTVVLAGWPPAGGPGGMQMTPFGMRPSGGKGGGHRG